MISAGIIPLSQKKGKWFVFLVKLKSGSHWSFPKGKQEKNESLFESAKRELLEETGLFVKELLLKEPFTEEYKFKHEKKLISKKVYYFLSEVSGSVKLQKEEILEGKWVLLDKAKEVLTYENSKKIMEQVIECLAENL